MRLEFVYRELIVFGNNLSNTQSEAIVSTCLSTLRFFAELRTFFEAGSLHPVQLVQTGLVGRPRIEVSPDQLSFLIENEFSVLQVADMIVSVQTVRRRMTRFGLSIQAQYSINAELDAIVREIQGQFLMCGNRQMQGHLLSRGYRIQQSRIRESQRRGDPDGSIIRRLHVLNTCSVHVIL